VTVNDRQQPPETARYGTQMARPTGQAGENDLRPLGDDRLLGREGRHANIQERHRRLQSGLTLLNYRERHKKPVAGWHCRDVTRQVHDATVVRSTWTD
jgi:hypothetical protein